MDGSNHICHLVASVSNPKLPFFVVHILLRYPARLCSWSKVLLFVMYTTPLSTLISSCSLNHHLYVDNSQLFLSFLPTHFDSNIDHLHNALDQISSWMTANLLTLNSSKTEFLLIGLSKQLAKINNSSLTTTHSARNRGFIFEAITIFVSFALSIQTSIPKQIPPSPLPLFTPSSTTATLFITTCPSVRSPGYNRSRTLLHVLCQSSQSQPHHSHPPVSTLVKDNWAHWMQAPHTYLQSSCNHPTFISA